MASPTLLTYSQNFSPSPLQANENGVITINITPPDTGVLCEQIIFTLPYGSIAGDIFIDMPTGGQLTPGSSGWTLSAPSAKKGTTEQTITLDNNNPGDTVPAAISFTITGNVNSTTTSGVISITENSAVHPISTPPIFIKKSTSLTVPPTVLPPLSLTSFIAHSLASPSIPTSDFANGAGFTLSWAGTSAINYQVFEGNNAAPIYNGTDTEYQMTTGLTSTTTFTLVATSTTGQTLIQTLTVTISDPILSDMTVTGTATVGSNKTPGALDIYGATTSNGAMTVNSELAVTGTSAIADATLAGTLSVTGDTTLAETTVGGTLTASAATALNSSLDVTGTTSLASTLEVTGAATLDSTLGVTGASSLNDVTVGGDLTIKGSGGKTFLVQGVISGIYMELNNCFSSDYRYYEVILENVIPATAGTYLRAQYYVNGAWATSSGTYSVETYSNDSGGNSADSYLDKSSLFLWSSARTGPSTSQGIYGELKIYNPAAIGSGTGTIIYLTHTGLIYSPRAYNNYGSQVYTGGAYSYTKTSGNSASGMRFFFSDDSVSSGVSSGTIRVYGWN